MKSEKAGRTFPHYLKPGADTVALKWIGKKLKLIRAKRSVKSVASAARVTTAEVLGIERGLFHLNLGKLREIIFSGYETDFEHLLAECYQAMGEHFGQAEKRLFERDYHYSICLKGGDGKKPTPFLIGGVPNQFLWAVPMRKLKGQPLTIELLELAPFRKKPPIGATPDNSHEGVEVIHVIHGTVEVTIAFGESMNTRKLRAGDSIHFVAKHDHQIQNNEKSSTALLLVVRLFSKSH